MQFLYKDHTLLSRPSFIRRSDYYLLLILGVYVSGWLGTGPVGVIAATTESGFTTSRNIIEDLKSGSIGSSPKQGNKDISKKLSDRGKQSLFLLLFFSIIVRSQIQIFLFFFWFRKNVI